MTNSRTPDRIAPNERDRIARDGLGETPRCDRTDTADTAAQVRSAVSRSHEIEDIHGSEIAAAPMGTDDEAGSTGPAPADVRARAEAAIRGAGAGGGRTPPGGSDA